MPLTAELESSRRTCSLTGPAGRCGGRLRDGCRVSQAGCCPAERARTALPILGCRGLALAPAAATSGRGCWCTSHVAWCCSAPGPSVSSSGSRCRPRTADQQASRACLPLLCQGGEPHPAAPGWRAGRLRHVSAIPLRHGLPLHILHLPLPHDKPRRVDRELPPLAPALCSRPPPPAAGHRPTWGAALDQRRTPSQPTLTP